MTTLPFLSSGPLAAMFRQGTAASAGLDRETGEVPMQTDGGRVIGSYLKSHQIPAVFTLCGGHISPILVGCRLSGVRVIDVRNEASAVFAADAMARLTGRPGVAVVTAGPGVTNTVTALQNARMAQSPVVLIGGSAPTILKNKGALQDIDQVAVTGPVVKRTFRVSRMQRLLPTLEQAFHQSLSGVPGPVFLECPVDLLYAESLVRGWYGVAKAPEPSEGIPRVFSRWYLNRHLNRMFAGGLPTTAADVKPVEVGVKTPDGGKLGRCLARIRHARRPVLIIGSQTMIRPKDTAGLAQAVEALGFPVYLTGMARGLLGRGHPLQMIHCRKTALAEADLVVIAGMPCDFRLNYGRAINPQAAIIAANLSRRDLNRNRRPTIGVTADPCRFLIALGNHGPSGNSRLSPWLEKLRRLDRERRTAIEKMAMEETDGLNPLRLLQNIDTFLLPESVIVADGGDFVASAAYLLQPHRPLSWLDPGVFGTLGVGAGFAMGAFLTRPQAEVWIVYGDGAAGFSLQEFDTFVRHRISVIAVVGNDAGWSQIARDQVAYLKDNTATVLNSSDYHRVVEGFGARGLLIEREEQVEAVLKAARELRAAGVPVLINARIGRTDFRKGSISM
jgi:acetolactate synthase-1/2/3 large subunit